MAATQTNISQTSIPDYAKKYIEDMLGKSWATTQVPYKAYPSERIAGLDPMTLRAMQQAGGMGTSKELDRAQGLMGTYAQQAAGTQYDPGNYANQYRGIQDYSPTNFRNQYGGIQDYSPTNFSNQYGGIDDYEAGNFNAGDVAANKYYRNVSSDTFDRGDARRYMSPYQQEVVNVQKREAARDADMRRQVQAGQSTRAGAFGGTRDALLQAEGERNLMTQMGDIQAKGSQSAYEQAMQQYNADQARKMQGQMANQQAGLTYGQQNLQGQLANQQMSLAEQQAREQSRQYGYGQSAQEAALQAQYGLSAQQAAEQSKQYGYGQSAQEAALRAQYGLSAQQAGEQSRQYGYGQMANEAALRAQYGLGANQLTEQSRQYGAGLGLQGLQAGMQGAQNLGAMGQTEFQQGMDINKLLAGYGTQRQQQQQNILQQQYQDFLNQRGYPQQQLSWFADMTRGLPLSQSTQQMYQAPPSALSQATGLLTAGAGAYGMYNMANRGYAEGGKVDSAPAGLGALALSKMG